MFGSSSDGLDQAVARRFAPFWQPVVLAARAAWGVRRQRIAVAPIPVAGLAKVLRTSANGGNYRRADPGCITGPLWIREMIADVHAAEPAAVPPAGVATLETVIVCGEGIICKETHTGLKVVHETLHNAIFPQGLRQISRAVDGSLYVRTPIRTYRRLVGPHVFLRQIWDANYGHWLVECLPRLAIVAEHYDLAEMKIIVSRNSAAMRRITLETLGLFGIRPDQIVEVTNKRPVVVDHLIYPLPMTLHPWVKAPRAIEILETLGARVSGGPKGPKRLYVSRAGARQRHLRNEADVLRVLEPYGFTVLHPEGMSFADQVRMFSSAEVIVGAYGANLTNAVFAPRGVKLFALTTEAMIDDFFWDLTNLKGGRYHALHGPATTRRPDLNSDFRIDLVAFRHRLEALLGRP